MKLKKYGSALLLLFLAALTVMLSIKHEQRRLVESAVQEESESGKG